MIVLELYRRGLISSGKAAALLGLARLDFIQRASDLGIPYFRFTDDGPPAARPLVLADPDQGVRRG